MTALLDKYRHVFLVGLQSNLVYRWNFGLRALFSLFHLAFVFILWGAAYRGQDQIGGFNLGQTITYFLTLLILQFFIGAFNEDFQISEEIRNGLINQFLLKPVNYFLYRFSIFTASRVVSGALAVLPIVLAYPFLRHYVTFPGGNWVPWLLAIPAVVMAAMIQFTIAFCFGLLTFWFLEIQSFVILSFAIETLLGGQVFPLDLMPKALYEVSKYLPYFYQMYFPAAIATGRIHGTPEILLGLGIQAFWVLVLLLFSRFLWQRGLRRHTAVGG